MSSIAYALLLWVACLAAFAGGMFGVRVLMAQRRGAARFLSKGSQGISFSGADGKGIEGRITDYLAVRSAALSAGLARQRAGARSENGAARAFDELVRYAGASGRVTVEGVRAARLRLAAIGGGAGLLAGWAISLELALLLAILGACAGAVCPQWALKRLETARSQELERSLPEMLEVVALGLRSGLSFDRSFQLYGEHFPTQFARECSSAQKSWSLGLSTREEALRALAASYRSEQFGHTVERIVRSLRFGSSLVSDLESAAAEARARRRAQVEERVAKAPVKMMVPTGALILPAMLILILGPILLELMQG